jgi:hypothetical protein
VATTAKQTAPEIIVLSEEEGRAAFDAAARRLAGMSGDEFIRRWEAGEFAEIADKPGHRHLIFLAGLIPFGRQAS